MIEFKKNLINLKNAVDNAISKEIDLNKDIEKEKMLYDFKEKQKEYYVKAVENALRFVKSNALDLKSLLTDIVKFNPIIRRAENIVNNFKVKDFSKDIVIK